MSERSRLTKQLLNAIETKEHDQTELIIAQERNNQLKIEHYERMLAHNKKQIALCKTRLACAIKDQK